VRQPVIIMMIVIASYTVATSVRRSHEKRLMRCEITILQIVSRTKKSEHTAM